MSKVDYKALRLMPAATLTLLLIFFLGTSAKYMAVMRGSGTIESTLYNVSIPVAYISFFFGFLAAIFLFICLYRLADLTSYFARAYNFFVAYVMAELLCRVLEWVNRFSGIPKAVGIVTVFIEVIPEIMVMLGVLFMLKGIGRLYEKMKADEMVKKTASLRVFWVVSEIILIFFSAAFLPVFYVMLNTGGVVVYAILIALDVLYIILSAAVIIRTRAFCIEYYMYRYNKGDY